MVLRFRRTREIVAAAALFFIVIFALLPSAKHSGASSWRLRSRNDITGGHPYVKPSSPSWAAPHPTLATAKWNTNRPPPPSSPLSASTPPDPDRVLVVAKLQGEDVSWLSLSFPDWQVSEYTISSHFALLHHSGTIVDKGRIANAYLTYLIENYYTLPSTIVFLTPHRNIPSSRSSYQNQKPISLGRYPLLKTLNIEHVQRAGYTNLRCTSSTTCLTTVFPFRTPPNEYRILEVTLPKVWEQLFPDTLVPEKLAATCCAEFAVSRDQVRKRELEEYKKFWEWLNKTNMDDETAGLVMEALWHVVFGQPHVDCEGTVGQCECDVYGQC